jgi:hypothetical protein
MRFFTGSISSGKTAPFPFLHKQLDVTTLQRQPTVDPSVKIEIKTQGAGAGSLGKLSTQTKAGEECNSNAKMGSIR